MQFRARALRLGRVRRILRLADARREELLGILRTLCAASPCIDPVFGPTATVVAYWTSTTSAADAARTWVVDFTGTETTYRTSSSSVFARAVRRAFWERTGQVEGDPPARGGMSRH